MRPQAMPYFIYLSPGFAIKLSNKKFMKKILLLLLFASNAIVLKAQTPTTPIEMNNYLMDIVNDLYARGKAWGAHYNEVRESKDFASLKTDRDSLEKIINQSIEDVEGLKDIKGSRMLRLAMLDFLQFEKTMVENDFASIEKLNKDSSDEEIDAALQKLLDMADHENEWLDKVRDEQKKYAEANGFTIED
jgi:hypothetical protein